MHTCIIYKHAYIHTHTHTHTHTYIHTCTHTYIHTFVSIRIQLSHLCRCRVVISRPQDYCPQRSSSSAAAAAVCVWREWRQLRLQAVRHGEQARGIACIRQHTSAYVSIRQHTSEYVSIRIRQHTTAYASRRGGRRHYRCSRGRGGPGEGASGRSDAVAFCGRCAGACQTCVRDRPSAPLSRGGQGGSVCRPMATGRGWTRRCGAL